MTRSANLTAAIRMALSGHSDDHPAAWPLDAGILRLPEGHEPRLLEAADVVSFQLAPVAAALVASSDSLAGTYDLASSAFAGLGRDEPELFSRMIGARDGDSEAAARDVLLAFAFAACVAFAADRQGLLLDLEDAPDIPGAVMVDRSVRGSILTVRENELRQAAGLLMSRDAPGTRAERVAMAEALITSTVTPWQDPPKGRIPPDTHDRMLIHETAHRIAGLAVPGAYQMKDDTDPEAPFAKVVFKKPPAAASMIGFHIAGPIASLIQHDGPDLRSTRWILGRACNRCDTDRITIMRIAEGISRDDVDAGTALGWLAAEAAIADKGPFDPADPVNAEILVALQGQFRDLRLAEDAMAERLDELGPLPPSEPEHQGASA